jgi:gas vesicle protein
MESQNNYARSSVALSFTVGGLVGASVAILFAPWEGRQTRGKLKELAGEVKEKSTQLSSQWKEKTSAFLEKRTNTDEREKEALNTLADSGNLEAGLEKEISLIPGEA